MSIEKASRNGNPVAASGRSLSGFAKEAVSILSGYRMLASVPRSLRSTFTDMLGTARNILTSQPPVDTAPPEITDAGDRFEWLREYNGVSEEEILSRRRTTRVWFTAWAFASVFMIAFAIAAPMAGLIGHSFLRPLDYTLPWSVAAVMVAKAMQWSLWNMQLRYRALLSFADWARSGEWLDPLSDKAKSVLGIVLAVGATSVIAHPATAAADVMNIQTLISTITADPTSATDLGMQMLARVFPSVFAISGVSYQQDAIAQIWATLNTLIMSVSTGMLTYHTLHAMVDVAHEGSVMGQGRWHATWAPLRVCVGVGSIVPLNGYCIAQLVMLRCVMAGFLLANVAWTQIVSITMGVGSNTASITIPPNPGQQMATFQAIIASEACYWALTYDNSPLIPASTPGAGIASPSGPGYSTGRKAVNYPDPNGTTQTLSDGNKAVVWDYGAVCGRITWPIRTAAAAQTQFGAASLINAIMPRTFDSAAATARETFDTARAQALGTFISNMRTAALAKWEAGLATGGFDASGAPDMAAAVTQSVGYMSAYKSAILSASSALSQALSAAGKASFAANAGSLGFMSAGALIPEMVRANAETVERVAETPAVEAPNMETTLEASKAASSAVKAIGGWIASNTAPGGQIDSAKFNQADIGAFDGNPSHLMDFMTGGITHTINSYLMSQVTLNAYDAIGDLQREGQILNYALTGFRAVRILVTAGAGAASGIAQGAANVPVVGWIGGTMALGVTQAIMALLTTEAGMLDIFEVVLSMEAYAYSVALPMLPTVFWLFACIGFLTSGAAQTFTASFWAFAHVRMDGKGFAENSGQLNGYGQALASIFRPVLALVGFFAAFNIMGAGVYLANQMLPLGADIAHKGSFMGLDTILWNVF